MNEDYYKLKQFIISNCIHFSYDSTEGPQNLQEQAFLFDLRELTMHPEMGPLAARLLWDRIKVHNISCLFTHGIGGVPLVTQIQALAHAEGRDLYVLVCRETRKTSNRRRLVEGIRPPENSRAIFIDDLMNSGDTYRQALDAIQEEGITLRVMGAAGIITMWAYTGSRTLQAQGLVSEFLFRRQDLGITRVFPEIELLGSVKNIVYTGSVQNTANLKSPPVIDGDNVYFATDEQEVFCYSISNNSISWKFSAPVANANLTKGIINKIAFDASAVYFNTYSGTAYKVDKITGSQLWAVRPGKWLHSSPTISTDGSKVYLGTEDLKPDGTQFGSFVCLDAQTGLEVWKYETEAYVPCTGHLLDNRIIFGNNANKLYCLNAETGNLWWSIELKGAVKGKAANIDNKVCVTTENGYMYIVDSQTGTILYENICAKAFRHNFVVTYNNCFYVFDTDGLIKCYNTEGQLQWLNRVRGALNWYAELFNDTFYLATDSGYAFSVDPKSGEKLRYSYVLKDDGTGTNKTIIEAPPATNGQIIVFNTSNKGVVIYDLSS